MLSRKLRPHLAHHDLDSLAAHRARCAWRISSRAAGRGPAASMNLERPARRVRRCGDQADRRCSLGGSRVACGSRSALVESLPSALGAYLIALAATGACLPSDRAQPAAVVVRITSASTARARAPLGGMGASRIRHRLPAHARHRRRAAPRRGADARVGPSARPPTSPGACRRGGAVPRRHAHRRVPGAGTSASRSDSSRPSAGRAQRAPPARYSRRICIRDSRSRRRMRGVRTARLVERRCRRYKRHLLRVRCRCDPYRIEAWPYAGAIGIRASAG